MKLAALQTLFSGIVSEPKDAKENNKAKESTWTFGVVEISSDKVEIAEEIVKIPTESWKTKLKKHGLEEKKVGPIPPSGRKSLAGGGFEIEDIVEIFSLTKKNPVIKKPIDHNGKLYVIRLIDFDKNSKEPGANSNFDFFDAWMTKLLAKAKVRSYLEQE